MISQDAGDAVLTPQREHRLIVQAQRGCKASAMELVRAHQDRLYAFVWRVMRRPHDAEEVCQETFLRAFSAIDTFDFNYRFSTWLFTIGYRLCLNNLRRRKNLTGDVDFSTFADRDPGQTARADVGDDVANTEEARRLKDIIWNSVDQLTPPQRAAVLLFYRESLSCQEIGSVLDMPAATVKSHLHRARNRLKEMLGDHLTEDWSDVRFGSIGES